MCTGECVVHVEAKPLDVAERQLAVDKNAVGVGAAVLARQIVDGQVG